MVNYTISTFNAEKLPEGFRFYILSRGANTGRPSHGPNTNCWVIRCNTVEDRAFLYAMCNAIYHAGILQPYLNGSVIPFIPLHRYKGILRTQLHTCGNEFKAKAGEINRTLLSIEDMISKQARQKELLEDMRVVLLRKYMAA
ncbi:MAG: hypothetical protein LAT81_09875 [Oceanicaulis sp.]|nr:hypothetical protein [Oceanicaulis sp.]